MAEITIGSVLAGYRIEGLAGASGEDGQHRDGSEGGDEQTVHRGLRKGNLGWPWPGAPRVPPRWTAKYPVIFR